MKLLRGIKTDFALDLIGDLGPLAVAISTQRNAIALFIGSWAQREISLIYDASNFFQPQAITVIHSFD